MVWLFTMVARFVSGAPMDGKRRTDGTFFTRGTKRAGPAPWFGGWQWWMFAAGWQRAAVRLAVVLALYVWWRYPTPTLIVAAAAALALAVRGATRVRPAWARWRDRRHERGVVAPLYAALAGQLGTEPEDRPGTWLDVPRDFRSNRDAAVELTLPATFEATVRQQVAINTLIGARLGGEWEPHWRTTEYRVFWTRPPEMPRRVDYVQSTREYEVHVGQSKQDTPVHISVKSESPHVLVAAPSGGGKSSTLRPFVAHGRAFGWLVDIIDPKRGQSLPEYADVPGVRTHTDIVAMIEAVEEFYLSMDAANSAAVARTLDPANLPRRLLVIDEMSSFVDMARNHYRRSGGKGDLPTVLQFQYIALQGRQAEHRMVVAPHQPDAKVFGSTAVRGSFAARVATGAMNRTLWVTAFGYAKQVKYNARIKGRGLIGYGEDDPAELQIVWLSPDDARASALAAPPPPEWFTARRLPPWVTIATIEQAATTAGTGWLSPWDTRMSRPAILAANVPGTRPPSDPVAPVKPPEPPSPSVTEMQKSTSADLPVPVPRLRLVRPEETPLIIGIDAAARFLGYDKPDSFRKARRRAIKDGHPIPEETRVDGRPAWTPAALRSWHSKRQIAGARPIPGAPDPTKKDA